MSDEPSSKQGLDFEDDHSRQDRCFWMDWFIVVALIDLACQNFGWPLPSQRSLGNGSSLVWIFDPSIRRRSIAIDFALRIITSIIVMILAAIAVMSLP
jgi:hypothetical protein